MRKKDILKSALVPITTCKKIMTDKKNTDESHDKYFKLLTVKPICTYEQGSGGGNSTNLLELFFNLSTLSLTRFLSEYIHIILSRQWGWLDEIQREKVGVPTVKIKFECFSGKFSHAFWDA